MPNIAKLTSGPVLALLAATAAPASAAEEATLPEPISIQSDALEWQPAPSSLPPGAEIAVLEGDLAEEELHTFRLKLPDGYLISPHSHPLREHITVLEGSLMMGMGETFDRGGAEALKEGAFFVLPEGDVHYAWAKGDTVVQLHGMGPWGIAYANPAHDPRKTAAQ